MPKTDSSSDLGGYATVAERLSLFWAQNPRGRIETRLHKRTSREVIFYAAVYRVASDPTPAATGWAAEREGDGDINSIACLENTETSAVGRALANMGLTASSARPSAEEMAKASRARARVMRREQPIASYSSTLAPVRSTQQVAPHPAPRPVLTDFLRLVGHAEREGFVRSLRAAQWRAAASRLRDDVLARAERRLRAYCERIEH